MRVLLDTNILLDVLLNRPGLADESEAVIVRCAGLGAEMFVAWHGLATAYYLLKRGRTEQEALAEVDRILAWARVAAAGDTEARRARALGLPDFEDALQAASAEACAADRIFGLLPADIGTGLRALWEEFEAAQTPDALFAKSLDRVQPVMANLMSGGGTWVTYDVTFDQLEARVGSKIAKGAPGLWTWVRDRCLGYFR